MKDISKQVSLRCNVCANDHFSRVDGEDMNNEESHDNTEFKFSDCGEVFTKAQLLEDNAGLIDANLEELKKEAFSEVEKELKKMFKKLR